MGKVCSVPGVGQRTWRKVLKECGEEKRDRGSHLDHKEKQNE